MIVKLLRDNKFTAALTAIGVTVAAAFGVNGDTVATIITSLVTIVLAAFGSSQDTKTAQQ